MKKSGNKTVVGDRDRDGDRAAVAGEEVVAGAWWIAVVAGGGRGSAVIATVSR